jgi:glutamate-5-semialdehyde dehydrogenase
VAQLGAIARQAGTPVSLHGTGGAWMVAGEAADAERFFATAFHSLDRKVCNTLNVCCIVRARADELVPVFLDALAEAGARRKGWKLHVAQADLGRIPASVRALRGTIVRAEGPVEEPLVEPIADADLGREWEWEETPEVSLKIVETVDEAVALFNRLSPRFAASLISEDLAAQDRFYQLVDAPFTGDGFTRWVDGQYALNKPELGLSNWQNGRLFARGGVLAGDGVFSVRARVRQTEPALDRGGEPTPPRRG